MMKPIATEKAVKLIELDNTLIFEVDRRKNKEDIMKDVEKMFNVKVDKVRSSINKNKKIAYVRLNKKNLAIDLATKLGMM